MWHLVCDADQHLNEPKDLYSQRLPSKLKDQAPKVIQLPGGGDAWEYTDRISAVGMQSTSGRNYSQFKTSGVSYEDMRPGEYDPEAHLKDMDIDGIYSACFFAGPGSGFSPSDGQELYLACLEAWNDLCLEDWQGTDPERLIALPKMPVTGIEDAVGELRRVAKKGARGVQLSAFPSGSTRIGPVDDRFWAEVQDLDIPVAIHLGFGGGPGLDPAKAQIGGKPISVVKDLTGFNVTRTAGRMHEVLSDIVLMGSLERFPKLTFLSVETGVGWFPFFMESTDDNYARHRFWSGVDLKLRPSELIRRQIIATFQIDTFGVKSRHDFGVNNIMWSSDYPHAGSDWPNSQRMIEFHMMGVPQEERSQMTGGNYARVFKLKDVPA